MLADDHPLVLAGLGNILRAEADIDVVGAVLDSREAVSKALELKPNVILMDFSMPPSGGLEAMITIKEKEPEIRVVILTFIARGDELLRALEFGAQGSLLKTASIAEVVEAVRKAASGEVILSPTLAAQLLDEFQQGQNSRNGFDISEREAETLKLVSDGLTNAVIAERLGISERMVGTLLQSLVDRLHQNYRSKALDYVTQQHQS